MSSTTDMTPSNEARQQQPESVSSASAGSSTPRPELIPVPEYTFPTHKVKRGPVKKGKTPLALVACGSFSPVTFLHLRMFEMASDFVRFNTEYVGPFPCLRHHQLFSKHAG
jgi:nicotinamide mononucleotide adenylyltransferase